MPQDSTSKAPPLLVETSVRQLIASGKCKTALENAKEFHKNDHSAASECLLLDAYTARIQSLLDQNLAVEAKSLLDLVRDRFPASRERLDGLKIAPSTRAGDLTDLLQPLNDPGITSERRATIEQAIQSRITDLAAIAECPALPSEHSLRQAAAALDRAFNAVTSGPVTEQQIALPEVSHRSPLASWKPLIRAIACFHRGDDEACRTYLAAIRPEAVPSRLVPAMKTMLGQKSGTVLRPAEAALVARTSVSLSELRNALASVDRAFAEGDGVTGIFKAVRAAVRECQRMAPDQLGKLKQIISVRGRVDGLDSERLITALGGTPRQDASYVRMYARAMESSDDPADIGEACELWDEFRERAVREGWFPASGVEVATLYLHMANVLGQVPEGVLRHLQRYRGKPSAGDERYFLFPDKLYARACIVDPHPDAFAERLRWAAGQSVSKGEDVAREWQRIRPNDIEPLLFLIKQAEKRNAFPKALSYLERAERIDAVHSVVRAARLRLLAAGTIRHLTQKKPHLAAEKLVRMEALPQSRQGDRPAFLAALSHLIHAGAGDASGTAEAKLEVEKLVGSVTAGLLIFGLAAGSKRLDLAPSPKVSALSRRERTTVPVSMARVMAIVADFGIKTFPFPISYLAETEAQFPAARGSLNINQIRHLGELGVAVEYPRLAWAASGEGLKRSGPTEAGFLLLRARAIPSGYGERYLALAAAAAELGRFHNDMEVVDNAIEIVRNPLGGKSISLTLEQAREVVRKELASPSFPGGMAAGPDYSELMPLKAFEPFDDEDGEDDEFDEGEMERIFNEGLPPEVPSDLAPLLLEIMREAFRSGKSPGEIMSRIMGEGKGGGKVRKDRRK